MPTRKIDDNDDDYKSFVPCTHPDHDPPSHQVFEPGLYEHRCSACGRTVTFRVPGQQAVVVSPTSHTTTLPHYVDVSSVPADQVVDYVNVVVETMRFIPTRH